MAFGMKIMALAEDTIPELSYSYYGDAVIECLGCSDST